MELSTEISSAPCVLRYSDYLFVACAPPVCKKGHVAADILKRGNHSWRVFLLAYAIWHMGQCQHFSYDKGRKG
jgi:hypothetical protein